ncbi:MAG: isoamylase early set domain-containing protein [Bacteroidales bacterium]|nr:isoamylase early set domain-containing protein [Bacteroidales bacterium]
MSIKKQILKSKPLCKVTFKVEKEQANNAVTVSVLGDFNHWDEAAGEMKANKDGSFTFTTDLPTGQDHHFRYLADGQIWLNEPDADKFLPSGYGDAENSVICL